MLSDDELDRIRDHAIANPSHAGDVVLRLVAEVERLKAELEEADREGVRLRRERPGYRAVARAVDGWLEGLGVAPTEGETR